MKAAYIHNCLKNGEIPIAGPLAGEEEEDDDENKIDEKQPEEHQEDIPSVPVNPPSAPVQAPDVASMTISPPSSGASSATLSYDKVAKAQKLCKYAISALDYQDTNTALVRFSIAVFVSW